MFNSKKTAYEHHNFSNTEDLLEEAVLVLSDEKSREPIPEIDGGFEKITVDDTAVVDLTVPAGAVSADIGVEASASTLNKSRAIRFKENGSDPSNTDGLYVGEGIFKVIGNNNLNRFKMIGIEIGQTHTVQIQYYKTVQTV